MVNTFPNAFNTAAEKGMAVGTFSDNEKRNKPLPQRIILYAVTNFNAMAVLGQRPQNPQPRRWDLNVRSRAPSLLDAQRQFHLVDSVCLLRLSARNSSQYLDWILKHN